MQRTSAVSARDHSFGRSDGLIHLVEQGALGDHRVLPDGARACDTPARGNRGSRGTYSYPLSRARM
jgi:hypothetical protein